MLTAELYEQADREQKRLDQMVGEWVECPVCKSAEGGEVDMVEDDLNAFIELKCKSCGAVVSRGVTDPPITFRMPTTVGGLEERLQGRLDAEWEFRKYLYNKLQQKSLSRRVLHYWWAARNVAARSFR